MVPTWSLYLCRDVFGIGATGASPTRRGRVPRCVGAVPRPWEARHRAVGRLPFKELGRASGRCSRLRALAVRGVPLCERSPCEARECDGAYRELSLWHDAQRTRSQAEGTQWERTRFGGCRPQRSCAVAVAPLAVSPRRACPAGGGPSTVAVLPMAFLAVPGLPPWSPLDPWPCQRSFSVAAVLLEGLLLGPRATARRPFLGPRPLRGVAVETTATARRPSGKRGGASRSGGSSSSARKEQGPDSNPRPSDPQPSILTTRTPLRY